VCQLLLGFCFFLSETVSELCAAWHKLLLRMRMRRKLLDFVIHPASHTPSPPAATPCSSPNRCPKPRLRQRRLSIMLSCCVR
jgi:hypothetical protein